MKVEVIRDVDGGFINRLKAALAGKRERLVSVGIPSTAKEEDGSSSAVVAAANEYGTANIPERPFLRTGVRKNLPKYKKLNETNLKAVVNGKSTIDKSLGLLGLMASQDVKDEITNGNFAPLDAKTIAARKRRSVGSSKPLIDTGQMRESITYEIVK